jgi:hypothetical protein
MQQTREELLRLAFDCLGRAARLLKLAEKDLLVIKGEDRRYGVRGGAAKSPIKDQFPCRCHFNR